MLNSTKLRRAKKLLSASNGGELFLFQGNQGRKELMNAMETVYSYRSSHWTQWEADELTVLVETSFN